jgi:hypothetical protein
MTSVGVLMRSPLNVFEARLHPAPRGADAAGIGRRVGQRLAGAETDQAGDGSAQLRLAGRRGKRLQRGLLARDGR